MGKHVLFFFLFHSFQFLRFATSTVRGSRPPPPVDVTAALRDLWRHPAVRACYRRRTRFQLNDSARYFLDDVERFCAPDFVPGDQDILRTRVRTTGIVRIEFEFGRKTFHMFDVGGQRSERKKWIHCFDNVTAILFVISLAEFDQVLAEDGRTNRMHESLTLFESIANSVYFRLKAIIIFFNKRDLFQEKLDSFSSPSAAASAIRKAFPQYRGDASFDDATDFIINKYYY